MLRGLHKAKNPQKDLLAFLKEVEGVRHKIYADHVGIPTIGVGYALNRPIHTIERDFAAAGYRLSPRQKQELLALLAQAAKKRAIGAPVEPIIKRYYALSKEPIILGDKEVERLLLQSLKPHRAYMERLIQGSGVTPDSQEYIALLSLQFNGILPASKKLLRAIKEGDRAEAWYEIRYNSNGGKSRSCGIAKRRVKESDLFHPYPSTPPTLADHLALLRTASRHEAQIAAQERAFPCAYQKAPIEAILKPAKEAVARHFHIPASLPMRVGTPKADILRSTQAPELLAGMEGDDTIVAGGGDLAAGGEGMDRYILTQRGATVMDEDGRGRIELLGRELEGSKEMVERNLWRDEEFLYGKSGEDLLIFDATGEEIGRIRGFRDGDFGIELAKEPYVLVRLEDGEVEGENLRLWARISKPLPKSFWFNAIPIDPDGKSYEEHTLRFLFPPGATTASATLPLAPFSHLQSLHVAPNGMWGYEDSDPPILFDNVATLTLPKES